MGKTVMKYLLIGLVGYGIYFMLANHIVITNGSEINILKKEKLTFTNSFNTYSDRKRIEYLGLPNILKEEDLRAAGIGEVLVERGLVTEAELEEAEEKVDSE